MHFHKITSEAYICIGGSLDLAVDDTNYILGKDQLLVTEPEELHAIQGMPETPYKGITLQFPSIPGDKYSPERERLIR